MQFIFKSYCQMRLFLWKFILRNYCFFPEEFVDRKLRVRLSCRGKPRWLPFFITYTTNELVQRFLLKTKQKWTGDLLSSSKLEKSQSKKTPIETSSLFFNWKEFNIDFSILSDQLVKRLQASLGNICKVHMYTITFLDFSTCVKWKKPMAAAVVW